VSEIAREIASQPACWRRAATLAASVADILPPRGARVAAVGCGTSLYIALAYGALREAAGQGETDTFAASEFPPGRRYDHVLAISRSGTTTEVLRLLERLPAGATSTVITADDATPAASLANRSIVLDFADERSVVQTRFATSALALLRAHLGEDLSGPIKDARVALEADLPTGLDTYQRFVFLGHGWTVGIAEEAALKLREAAQLHTEAYPAMEYRHGPISLADAGALVWLMGSPDPNVADDAEATGASVWIASLDPMAELVLVHRCAVALADARGLDADHPRNLTRSVVLSVPGAVSGGDAARMSMH
jgi:fructoselysine-6-P-deglycase FrlB-like protein